MSFVKKEGKVVSVRLPEKLGSHVTKESGSIFTQINSGIVGDSHSGMRLADVRELAIRNFGLPKGFPIANHREFSMVSVEELNTIYQKMGIKGKVKLGLLGENLVVEGIPSLTKLPSGTLLFFSKPGGPKRYAILAVWGENTPCEIVAESFAETFKNDEYRKTFPPCAMGLRGIVGSIYSSGKIKTGDVITAIIPS